MDIAFELGTLEVVGFAHVLYEPAEVAFKTLGAESVAALFKEFEGRLVRIVVGTANGAVEGEF